ncbi:MAG: 50S ribosomal protein L11 [Candidatus Shapirobacteria bacterium]|nr:50S ribosomal protein L11 [Candidatus Shapirobacteria bacterium]
MAKKIKAIVKIAIQAGSANPAPPVGTALGPHGIKIMDFCNEFNEKTKDQRGSVIPALVTIYEDRSFEFILKKPPVSDMIKKMAGISKGTGTAGKEKVGKLTMAQVEQIAQTKMPDLNTKDLEAAKRSVMGTAKSMGVEIIEK